MNDSDDETPQLPAPLPGKIFERLFQSRTILIHGEIEARLAQSVTAQLLALASEGDEPITVFIFSEGGHVEAGDTIHDMIRFVKPRVRMIGTGWVASAGTHIYLAAPKKDRFCLPNTRFLLHEPRGGVGGMASDVEIQAREILRMRERLNEILVHHTGQPFKRIQEDTERDYIMSRSVSS